jgi:hypothetical protein
VSEFQTPTDLSHNRGLIADPAAFARDAGAASWLAVAALDGLPRPTLVTCRTGPRSSALVYLYGGLLSGASADDVLACAEADGAPFIQAAPLKAWVAQGLAELSSTAARP